MAKTKTSKKKQKKARRWLRRVGVFVFLIFLLPVYAVVLFAFFNPSAGFYMGAEARRLGGVKQQWTALEDFSPAMARSVVAAEDAHFCAHYGFDLDAIRDAIEGGGKRGASHHQPTSGKERVFVAWAQLFAQRFRGWFYGFDRDYLDQGTHYRSVPKCGRI